MFIRHVAQKKSSIKQIKMQQISTKIKETYQIQKYLLSDGKGNGGMASSDVN